jgi:hypothetical protein
MATGSKMWSFLALLNYLGEECALEPKTAFMALFCASLALSDPLIFISRHFGPLSTTRLFISI